MAQTSIHICPVKGGSEVHNERRKILDYVRHDLTKNNERYIYPEFQHGIDAQLANIKADYEAAHGKKLHAKATPIREAVVVIQDTTTMDQIKEFCKECKEKWGIQAMQIYTHKDEGHINEDKKWVPNLHTHIVFSWYNTQTHTTCKLSRQNMAEMQTLLAKCLGMERGVSSDKKHLTAIQQRIAATEKQLEDMEAEKTELKTDLQDTQRATRDAIFKCCYELQHIGKNTVKNFDLLCKYNAVRPTRAEQQDRDELETECKRNLSTATTKELIHKEHILRTLLYNTSRAVERIGKKLQMLAKGIPLLKRHRLAHEAELQASVEAAESSARASAEDAQIAIDRATNAQTAANNALNKAIERETKAQNLQDKLKAEKANWLKDFRTIAKQLTSLNAESVALLEQMGLRDAVGTNIWDAAKEEHRRQKAQQQTTGVKWHH